MTPIYDNEKNGLYGDFFGPKYASQRLGKPGRWLGGATAKLDLKNPVERETFEKLLQGRTPQGEQLVDNLGAKGSRVKAWHHTLSQVGSLSSLWALSPPIIRARIRLAHNRAVQATVADFERNLNGSPYSDKSFTPGWKLPLFAAFQSGASENQAPRLETTLFLFNFTLHRGGGIGSLNTQQIRQQQLRMQSVYSQVLKREVLWILGDRVLVPRELAAHFKNSSDLGLTRNRDAFQAKPLQGADLYSAWHEQARNCGWGTERVQRLLLDAKLRNNWRNWTEELRQTMRVGSLWMRDAMRAASKRLSQKQTSGETHKPETPKKAEQDKSHDQSY